jgi:hypothetical protein
VDAIALIKNVALLHPEFSPVEQLRLALLVSQQADTLDELIDVNELDSACENMGMQLSAASDQHNAVADELDSLAAGDPCEFSSDHVWTLVRAIKVQSQILNLYLGPRDTPTHLG